jgi:hypothetical protein
MKLLLGTIIALLLAALVMSWTGMRQGVAATSQVEIAKMREQIAAISAEQKRQALETQYVRNGGVPVAPPPASPSELEAVKAEVDATRAMLDALAADKAAAAAAARDDKLSAAEDVLRDQMDIEKNNKLMRDARLIRQALLVAKVTEFREDAELGNFATINVLMPEQVQVDTILAIRRNDGILGQLKVTMIEGSEAVASPLPGFGPVALVPGDELILPPRL